MLGERALWALIGLTLLFFFRPLSGDTFFFRDVYLLFYGKKLLLAEALRHGQIPLWDPLMNGGQPFLASPGNSALYPFNIIFLLLPPLAAFNVHLVLQFVCCAVSSYFLARAVGLSTTAAFVCGSVYTFCGYVLSSATLLVLMQAVPWAPALLASMHLLVTEQRKRWLVASAIFGALPILGGGADMSAMSFALAAAWALTVPREVPIGRRIKLVILAIGFAAGLTLMLTLPAYEVIRNSSRGEKRDYATFVQWSVSPQRLPELVIPRFFGPTDTLARRDYWGGKYEYGYPYMVSIYFGASVFLLALFGLTSTLRGRFLLGAFALAGFVLCLGGYLPFFHALWEHVPLIGIFRFPVKALQLTLVPMSVLCGCGLEPAQRGLKPAPTLVIALLMIFATVFRGAIARAFFGIDLPAEFTMSFVHACIAIILLAGAVLWKRPAVIAAVVFLDLATAGWRVNPYASRELFVTPPLATKVKAIIGEGRLYRTPDPYVQRLNVPTNDGVWLAWWDLQLLSRYTAATFGIPLVFHEDYDGLAPIRMARMTAAIAKMPWPERLDVLSRAGATVIITPDLVTSPTIDRVDMLRGANGLPLYVYRNRAATPLRFEPCVPTALQTIRRSLNSWSVEVTAPCNGTLIFAETFYPGWRMSVDDRDQPQLLADFGLSSVAVPAGHHIVEKTYRPRLPLIGLICSIATALALAFWRVNQ
jgi:hypothetical protein